MGCRKCAGLDHNAFSASRLIWVCLILALCMCMLANREKIKGRPPSQAARCFSSTLIEHTTFSSLCIVVLSGTIHFKDLIKVCCIRLSVVIGEAREFGRVFDSYCSSIFEKYRVDDCGFSLAFFGLFAIVLLSLWNDFDKNKTSCYFVRQHWC